MIFYEVRIRSDDNDKHIGFYQNKDNAINHILNKAIKIDNKFYRCTPNIIDVILGGNNYIKYDNLEEVDKFIRTSLLENDESFRYGVRCINGYRYILVHQTSD